MFNPLGKLLCAAALAGTALVQAMQVAQNISILAPLPGTNYTARQAFTVEVERTLLSDGYLTDVGLLITCCPYGQCPNLTEYLGQVAYSGPFTPQPADAKTAYQNFTVDAPDWYDGFSEIIVTLFFVQGAYSTPVTLSANTSINVMGAEG